MPIKNSYQSSQKINRLTSSSLIYETKSKNFSAANLHLFLFFIPYQSPKKKTANTSSLLNKLTTTKGKKYIWINQTSNNWLFIMQIRYLWHFCFRWWSLIVFRILNLIVLQFLFFFFWSFFISLCVSVNQKLYSLVFEWIDENM